MASQAIKINVTIAGARETLAAFRRLPKEASNALRDRSYQLAQALAGKVASAARADSPQSALMAPTVKPVRDRIPYIQAGGTTRVATSHVPAYKIIFGSEFGARSLPQYRAHVGKGSYWMFRTVEANEATIEAEWLKAADDIVKDFTSGPGGE